MTLPLKKIGSMSDSVPLPEEGNECGHVCYCRDDDSCPCCRGVCVADPEEPGCNDCDGFVYVGDTCKSCGLKGNIPRRHSLKDTGEPK